ncbi:hypothetical protein PQQ86_25620 [Paraburkholderia sediminicola]|uniref:Uncharacterized protein n=1 Tax=Paraburkholderia metrosideri TaxID=580937 RepID=A0ABW9DWM1_9BURK
MSDGLIYIGATSTFVAIFLTVLMRCDWDASTRFPDNIRRYATNDLINPPNSNVEDRQEDHGIHTVIEQTFPSDVGFQIPRCGSLLDDAKDGDGGVRRGRCSELQCVREAEFIKHAKAYPSPTRDSSLTQMGAR